MSQKGFFLLRWQIGGNDKVFKKYCMDRGQVLTTIGMPSTGHQLYISAKLSSPNGVRRKKLMHKCLTFFDRSAPDRGSTSFSQGGRQPFRGKKRPVIDTLRATRSMCIKQFFEIVKNVWEVFNFRPYWAVEKFHSSGGKWWNGNIINSKWKKWCEEAAAGRIWLFWRYLVAEGIYFPYTGQHLNFVPYALWQRT